VMKIYMEQISDLGPDTSFGLLTYFATEFLVYERWKHILDKDIPLFPNHMRIICYEFRISSAKAVVTMW
jgi:hypothetical protein